MWSPAAHGGQRLGHSQDPGTFVSFLNASLRPLETQGSICWKLCLKKKSGWGEFAGKGHHKLRRNPKLTGP